MSSISSELDETNFSGIVRLFPLPNLVLFPGVIQPLHIFEPRYRQMVQDAIAADSLIAVALLRDSVNSILPQSISSESENTISPESSLLLGPPIHEYICIGKVVSHVELEDGRYNLLLQGINRARINRELPAEVPYRLADVELIDEPVISPEQLVHMRTELLCNYRRMVEVKQFGEDSISQLIEQDLSLGTMIDLMAFSLELDPLVQQKILATVHVERRGSLLLHEIQQQLSQVPLSLIHI